VVQVVECLSSKCEALSSNPITAKKKKERIYSGQALVAYAYNLATQKVAIRRI
jgi:hypothetical protein